MAGGRTDPKIACRLLLSAAMMDAAIVVLLTKLLATYLATRLYAGSTEALYLFTCGGVLLAYWLVTELLLGGLTPGRACLGIEPRTADGRPLPARALALRFALKAGTLGVGGLRLNRLAHYDRRVGVAWHSTMQPVLQTSPGGWRLMVASGAHKGTSLRFDTVPGFQRNKTIRIGRDQKWADLALPQEPLVSGKHCLLMLRDGGLALMDQGTDGTGSQNGTMLNGRRLRPKVWTQVGGADGFSVANVGIRIAR